MAEYKRLERAKEMMFKSLEKMKYEVFRGCTRGMRMGLSVRLCRTNGNVWKWNRL